MNAHDPSVDISAVHHDDEFLQALIEGTALPGDGPVDPAEAELGALLFAWRTEVLAVPMPAEPTLEDVEQAVADTDNDRKRQAVSRHLRMISGAAAITAVAAAGLLVLSENSQPGDPLWNVKKVVFADEAQQTQAAFDVQNGLERAETALSEGEISDASDLVDQAERELESVQDADTRTRMQQWIARLRSSEALAKDPAPSTPRPSTPSTDPATPPAEASESTSVTVTVTPSVPPTSPEPPPSSSTPPSSSSATASTTASGSSSVSSSSVSSTVPKN
ncbi:anti-sigma-D factor RsdA [Gordonia alkaliphila]|uniref:anti-sigma-D factor RsdA n=1 Tax=Gordonia alkaliphila TaxID=1053547 RepID=UPI001FF59DDE|nr:anti-sigma-D factor RsdA [Gordonia alkaliphila]MCK0439928.1 anti-sigma-D factor RsdA [Gordonia alkaliphila]